MKKILLLLALLVSTSAKAEDYYLPDGCYVSFANPNFCYDIPTGDFLVWDLNADQVALSRSYGPALAIILSKYNEVDRQLDEALTQWDLWSQKSAKQAKQIKRLKAQLAALK